MYLLPIPLQAELNEESVRVWLGQKGYGENRVKENSAPLHLWDLTCIPGKHTTTVPKGRLLVVGDGSGF